MRDQKMRIWWMPQVGANATFFIPVETVEEAKKFMDILAAYDCFQHNHDIKPDYCNVGGLQVWDSDEQEWNDWEYEDETDWYDDVDQYIEEKSDKAEELSAFADALYSQIKFD